jgi:hypothetical protein
MYIYIWRELLLTERQLALAWFCYDFVTYPFGLFSSTIIEQLNPNNTTVQNIGYGVCTTQFVSNPSD